MRRHLTPSMAVSLTAMVVALGGTSYAAVQLSSNSVGQREIKTNGVGASEIRSNAVRSAEINANAVGTSEIRSSGVGSSEIRNGSILSDDLNAGTRAALRGQTGPAGPQGAAGPQGPAGPARWLLVNAAGEIEAQSGGFTVKTAYGSNGAPVGAAGNVYIDAGEDLTDNGIVASIALQNGADQPPAGIQNGRDPDPDENPEFSGEITATRCAIPSVVTCAPTGTNTTTHFVVSPRLSDGRLTDADTRKRFYVVIAG